MLDISESKTISKKERKYFKAYLVYINNIEQFSQMKKNMWSIFETHLTLHESNYKIRYIIWVLRLLKVKVLFC